MFFTIEVDPLAGINPPPSVGRPISSTAMGYCDVVFVDSHLNEAVVKVPPPPKPMTPARPLVYLSHASPTRYVYADMTPPRDKLRLVVTVLCSWHMVVFMVYTCSLGDVEGRSDGRDGTYYGNWYQDSDGNWWPYWPQLM